MPYLTPAEARARLDQLEFRNSAQERDARAEIDRLIAAAAAPVYESAVNVLKGTNEEAATYAKAAADHVKAANDLQARMKRREIHPADARKERDRLVREGMKLRQLLDSLTKVYENNLYIRDHPEESLTALYEQYPQLQRPYFPIRPDNRKARVSGGWSTSAAPGFREPPKGRPSDGNHHTTAGARAATARFCGHSLRNLADAWIARDRTGLREHAFDHS